jgi:cytochrome c oxidase accessory protein FixG
MPNIKATPNAKTPSTRTAKPKIAGPALSGSNYHRTRKLVHLACFLIFVALPFSNFLRFDIPRQRFHFLGYELWISEFSILFFALMFLMFLIVVGAMLYGRIYCGYLCPQMIFSEVSLQLEEKLRRAIARKTMKWSAGARNSFIRAVFYAIVGTASVFLSFVFISYFVEPVDLFKRLLALDIRTAGGIAGATVTLITFLDFTLVRQKFCTTICPYGYLQGMLTDGHTLLVQYRDPESACIECKKCIRVCHMGIDIRKSPFQIECVHCAECIDACSEIMGKLGQAGLIHYAWGEAGELLTQKQGPWYHRIGLRDPKRVVIMLVLVFYTSGLFVALSMRHPVLVRIMPERATLYRVGENGLVYNKFRLNAANRGTREATVELSLENLAGASIQLKQNPFKLDVSQQVQEEFEISADRFQGAQEVNHFRIRLKTSPGDTIEYVDMTFLMPPEKKSK